MGVYFTDKYSLLHFAMGISMRFFNMSFMTFLIIHTLFELIENTKPVMKFIDHYICFWPGGKKQRDSNLNMIGDTFYASIGFLVADYVISLCDKE